MIEEKKEKKVVKKPKSRKGMWVMIGIVVYLLLTIGMFYVLNVRVRFVIGFYFASFLLGLIGWVVVYAFKSRITKVAPSMVYSPVDKKYTAIEQISKDFMFNQEGVQEGIGYFKGIKPIRMEEGGVVYIYGWHFRDRDTNNKYVYAMNVNDVEIKSYEKLNKELMREEYNTFLSELARGQRDVRTITTQELDMVTGKPMVKTIKEPILIPTMQPTEKEVGKL